MITTKSRKEIFSEVEGILKHYNDYKTGIKNMKQQLNFIMPGITANYELVEGSVGTFAITSKTEKYAIDRIESKKALDLHEQIEEYEIKIRSIDNAVSGLKDLEKEFVRLRYFQGLTVEKVAQEMGYSRRSMYHVRLEVLEKLAISLRGFIEQ